MKSVFPLSPNVLLCLIALLAPAAQEINPTDERVYSLLGHGSSVELHTFQWLGDDQLIVRFAFQTHSYDGQLIRLIATNANLTPVLEIKASVGKRTISISAEDFLADDDPVSLVHFQETDVSDGVYHTLSINIDPSGDLLAELDGAFRTGRVGLQKSTPLDTTIFIGGPPAGASSGVRSVIGCIGKFSVLDGSTVVALMEEKREGDVGDGCLDACKGSACGQDNPSGCVNFHLEPICDCVGTQKEGAFCTEDPKMYHFDGHQYTAYEFDEFGHHGNERQPRRFHISFKIGRVNDPSTLLYASLALDNVSDADGLAAIVNKASIEIRLRGDKLLEAAFNDEVNNPRWHDLTISIHYPKRQVSVKLDNEPVTSAVWNPTHGDIVFRDAYFGGYETETVAKNFRGCMRSIYIDYLSIGHLINHESPRIKLAQTPIDATCPSVEPNENGLAVEPPVEPDTSSTTLETTTFDSTTVFTTEATESTQQEHSPTVLLDEQPSVSPSPVVTTTCSDLRCEHGAKCVQPQAANAYCDCQDSGYAGKLCQFSNLPRSCDELYELGEFRSGVFRIDPDGTGPIEPVSVKCVMDGNEGGVTYVDHNFVNGTYVRQLQQKDTVYLVVYRNMSVPALKQLISNSETCEQYFKYECNQAPLMLPNSTWFKSANYERTFSGIGGPTDDQQCPCGRQNDCGRLKCTCDAGDKETRVDDGFHLGQFAGLTEMTFLQKANAAGWAKVTLGPLACRGSSGVEDSVQFRARDSSLKFPKWEGQQLSFWFRTSVKNGCLFSQGSNGGRFFNVDLDEGHILSYAFNLRKDGGAAAVSKRLVSQSPLNDDAWHKVSVEKLQGELRFSIDDEVDVFHTLTQDESLDASSFDQQFVFGGSNDASIPGFIGCVRHLILNNAKQTLSTSQLPIGVSAGCQSHCTDVACQNNAECVEDYEADTYKCKCVNEYTQLGAHCETDINVGTEVSFHDSLKAYLLVRDFAVNPVANNRLVFSFRTDQISAILLFAHDENYNMVQIHLTDGNRIALTVNYGKELLQCTIVKKQGDFNNMQWFQVVVLFDSDHTALFVNKDMCQIDGGRRMSNEYLEEWDGDIQKLRVVFPPRSPVPPSQMPAYTLLYVGGIRRAGMYRGQFQQRIRRQSGQIVYTSSLPNLLGCVRGFMVGDQSVELKRWNRSIYVRDGCDFGCGDEGQLHCEHDGYCQVAWQGDHRATCDCVPTSYFGPSCTLDHGMHFDGTTSIRVQLELILQRVRLPEYRSYDSLSFAFSTSRSAVISTQQILAYIGVNAEKDARVYLLPDGQLALEIKAADGPVHVGHDDTHVTAPYRHTFSGNYNDGERHYVFLKFFGDKLVAKVDSHYHEVHAVKWRLSEARTVSIGGIDSSSVDETDIYAPYSGCMSNALIEFRSSIPYVLKPFDDLLNPTGAWHEKYLQYLPDGTRLDPAQCAQFTALKPMPTDGPVTALPPFTEPMHTLLYVDTTASPGGGKGGGVGVAIGLAVVVIITLLCIGIYFYYVKCVKNRRRGGQYEQPPENGGDPGPTSEEKQVFIPPGPVTPDTMRPEPDENLTQLPEANKDLDDRSNRGSVTPSPPPPYAPTATPPLAPPHVAAKERLHPVDSLENFPPPPTDEELKALTPNVRRNPSVKRGAFVYGFPDIAFVDDSDRGPVSPRSPKPNLAQRPSIPRRMPINVPIPNI